MLSSSTSLQPGSHHSPIHKWHDSHVCPMRKLWLLCWTMLLLPIGSPTRWTLTSRMKYTTSFLSSGVLCRLIPSISMESGAVLLNWTVSIQVLIHHWLQTLPPMNAHRLSTSIRASLSCTKYLIRSNLNWDKNLLVRKLSKTRRCFQSLITVTQSMIKSRHTSRTSASWSQNASSVNFNSLRISSQRQDS